MDGTAGAGVSMTSGNSDNMNYNRSFDVTRTPKARNVMKWTGDGLYTFSIGLATRIPERLQLSIDLLGTFRNRPPTPVTTKNDVAFVTAVTSKF